MRYNLQLTIKVINIYLDLLMYDEDFPHSTGTFPLGAQELYSVSQYSLQCTDDIIKHINNSDFVFIVLRQTGFIAGCGLSSNIFKFSIKIIIN